MARPLRIELAGGVYHVTSRGDRREMIYGDDADRRAWVDLFGEVCDRFNWRCHAWCQMGNHYHVVVETAEANLSRGMRQMNGVYTQAVNRRHGRVGHVFQGRYKAVPVIASDSAGDGASWFSKPIRLGRQSGQYDAEIDQKYRKNVNPCTLTPFNRCSRSVE